MSVPPDQRPSADRSRDLPDLDEHYGSYCRAMRMLVREGKSLKTVQRTVCWQQLARLHDCRPARYQEPDALYLRLCREGGAAGGGAAKR
ncbi:hypothetical protein L107_11915 [Cyanobium sp. Copco_Reservoir_LC18]|jgi:hypothetical protein|uniref:DUF3136 domain-containing protein n=1 Tax=Cyanobium sp. Copco_Reservoir_LC18 TaxID=1328305 RepID=UPI0013567D38|nr:DUF3136 domain-containing protein [Cyanobium sp. Copco_Reservoir_LC18]KAF0652857.1 hypothetical protein L107_11915 [Cyanobium sp. Copco_Reservoir_LC18]